MNRYTLITAFSLGVAAGCAAEPSDMDSDVDPTTATSKADGSANVADHGCRVFLFNAGIPSHRTFDGDLNQVSAINGLQDSSGHYWWPFTADVGLGRYVPGGVTVGMVFSIDGHTWKKVETN